MSFDSRPSTSISSVLYSPQDIPNTPTPARARNRSQSNFGFSNTNSRTRPSTSVGRPRSAATSGAGASHHIVCSVTESRGVSATVGLCFVNLSTGSEPCQSVSQNSWYLCRRMRLERDLWLSDICEDDSQDCCSRPFRDHSTDDCDCTSKVQTLLYSGREHTRRSYDSSFQEVLQRTPRARVHQHVCPFGGCRSNQSRHIYKVLCTVSHRGCP